jgi:hypothetical protein
VTGPGSRIVRHRGMLIQGYNVQTAVAEGQIILAAVASATANDPAELAPTVQRAKENLARAQVDDPVEELLADSGYWTSATSPRDTRLLRRGREAVQAEIDLIATTHHLRRLFHTVQRPQIA